MRAATGIAAMAFAVASASAEPKLEPKRPNLGYTPQALESFLEGLSLQLQGEPKFARDAYSKALGADNKQPATYFNLGIVSLGLERMDEAERMFRYYLQYAPKDAPDRAAITKLQQQLANANPIVVIGGLLTDSDEEADALILLDGKVIGHSPLPVQMTPGPHDAERITATTYKSAHFNARKGERQYLDLSASKADDGGGNVLISGFPARSWKQGTTRFEIRKRFTLPKGTYSASPDTVGPKLCNPIEFEVTSEQELTYVRLVYDEFKTRPCTTIDKVVVQRLKVGAP